MAERKGRILVVDDEAEVRSMYKQCLTEEGFDVEEARSGAEALRRVGKAQFDLVLADLVMPKMDGLQLLEGLKEESPDLSVVITLEAADNTAAVKAVESGALQTLVKPIDRSLLVELANHAVRLRRSHSAALPAIRNRRGELVEPTSVSATEAKNEFGRVLERVLRGEFVVITKHEAPKAVLMSVDEFNALSPPPAVALDALSEEFDALLAWMQAPAARAGLKAAFDASAEELGQAAVAGTRPRD